MNKSIQYLLIIAALSSCKASKSQHDGSKDGLDSITSIHCELSAFGVESDDFPSIIGDVDFRTQVNSFEKSFYDPKIQGSKYALDSNEIIALYAEIKKLKLAKQNIKYSVDAIDLPKSILLIQTKTTEYKVEDYGLKGTKNLQHIYGLIYKTGFKL